jgi:hypothetical protein
MKKITRRVALGSFVAAMLACPFLVRALRGTKDLPVGEHPDMLAFKKHFEPRLSLPRVYNGVPSPKLTPAEQETALRVHKRYWENFVKIDELEFDYSYRRFVNGKEDKDTFWCMDVHIRMKYGHGLEAKGKNAKGEAIHLKFNLSEGVFISLGKHHDLSSMMLSLFGLWSAHPEFLHWHSEVLENVTPPTIQTPKHLFEPSGKYDMLGLEDPMAREPRITRKRRYFSHETGMLEADVHDYKDDSEMYAYEVSKYTEVNGIFLPVFIDDFGSHRDGQTVYSADEYSNYSVKIRR